MIKLQKNNGSIDFNTITMLRGEDGGYYIPAVDENGNLSWIATGEDMPEVETANIQGPVGPQGIQGPIGLTGAPGKQGERGESGVYVGAIEPTDDSLIWINPEGEAGETLATKQYVDDAIAAAGGGETADLSNYYTKDEIIAFGYQTEAQVNALIETALGVIENGSY